MPRGSRALIFPGISWIVIIMALVAVLFHLVSTKSRTGRHFRMVGSKQEAAWFSGIEVNRVKRFVCVLAGMLPALFGVLLTSRLGFPPGGAVGYEMVGITCAMIGGVSLSGGVGSIGWTVIGSFIIGTLATGLSMMNTSNPALARLFNGIANHAVVCLDQVRNRKSAVRRREPGPKGRRVPKLTPFVLILRL
jgi:ribose/xylose/arabinose/galactoside ABC-type transport system permease subunit